MSAWLKKLRDVVEEVGYSYEAEETMRIHIGDIIVEVGVEDGKYAVTVSVPLPGSGATDEEVDYYARLYEQGLRVLLGLGGDVKYEVDTSLPDYPSLHMTRLYDDADKLVEDMSRLLRKLVEVIPPSGGVEG
ncbi:hypothetical protein Pyrfu_1925 [Pyrolobus fumarii 1A]|uniref:Uncharacterized protein n=1 Tax=Pyrolobus fumarii (strain DSM 11204 / 1A) TaxID=694429 RepID=G0EDA0_PYRF1|nr:hypothetical protein [Pyrolobus fumarii]AEM39778.1 hypothetical protein Pyrfu_1925 [Pyrolobus fumarii 1A]